MSYGYLGDTSTSIKQQVKNAGVLTPNDILELTAAKQISGSLEFIGEQSLSGSSTAILTTIKEDVYDVHYFELVLTGSHQDHTIFLDMSTNGGSSYVNADFSHSKQYGQSNGTFNQTTNASTANLQVAASVDSNNGCNIYGYLYNLGNANSRSHVNTYAMYERSGDAGVSRFEWGGALYRTDGTINAIKFYPNVGTMTGTLKLYGVKQ